MMRAATLALAVLALVAGMILAFSAPVADAALRSDGRLAQVLEPRRDGTVRGNSVTVRVRVKPTVRSFTARVGSREVAERFLRRERGRLRVAKLRVGRATGVRYGENRLELHVRDGRGAGTYRVVRFAVVRRAQELLRVGGPRRSSRRARVRLRLARKRVAVRLRLNGRRVRLPASARPGRRLRIVRLAGSQGLRHGRNVLRVVAVDRLGGRFAVKRRTVFIRRTAPIPAAGHDRRVLTKRHLRLDARATRAAHAPPSLRYRWRIVRKPRGSHARLRAATTRRPRLRPDLPGRYRLRMTVLERSAGQRPSAFKGASDAPRPGCTIVDPRCPAAVASDTTTVSATPDGDGIGVAVNTDDARRVTVGDQHYAPQDPSKSLQLVVLDRSTLELKSNASFAGDASGTKSLASTVSGLAARTIAIIATRAPGNRVAPIANAAALANVNRAVAAIGGREIPAAAALTAGSCFETTPVCGGFSAIGTPGFAAGAGWVNPGLGRLGGAGAGGALTGYLQFDQTGTLFTFVQGDHVAFDTAAGGDPAKSTQASIRVGSATYNSEPLQRLGASVVAGAYVLVLDAGTLALREQGTFGLPGGPAASIPVDTVAGDENRMAVLLNKYKDDPSALVFVQTIGLPGRWDSQPNVSNQWNVVARSLQALGGHRTLFNALDDASYAQVAPAGPSAASWAKVASQAATRTPGQLAGTLARNDSSQFYPDNATGSGGFGDDLTVLAYQRATPWPLRGTTAGDAALRCVAGQLKVGKGTLGYPIEDGYTDTNLKLIWGNLQDDLRDLVYDDLKGLPGCDTSKFVDDDLTAVKDQLKMEFTSVGAVWGLIDNLKSPYVDEEPAATVSSIAGQIRESLPAPRTPVASLDGLGIAQEFLYVIGALGEIGGQEEVPIGMELIAAGLGLIDETALQEDGPQAGQPLSALSETTVATFADDLHRRYEAASSQFDQIGEILVGDWDKLQTAAGNAAPGGPWDWDPHKQGTPAKNALEFGATRYAYATLFPKAYGGMLRGTNGNSALDIPDDTSRYECWQYTRFSQHHPFYPFKTQQFGGVTPVIAAGLPNVRENWVFSMPTEPNDGGAAEGNIIYEDFTANVPSKSLMSEMFGDDAPGAAMPPLQQLEFMLSIRSQLQVLTVYRTAGQSADGSDEYNICQGKLTDWPSDL